MLDPLEPGFFATGIMSNADDDPGQSGPYAVQHEWVETFYRKNVASSGAALSTVADAIVAAADDPQTPLHVLVGDDAFQFVALVDSHDSFEALKPVSQQIIEGVAGPRPK